MSLSIVIPAWNEEHRLPGCLAALQAALAATAAPGRQAELIVVDNNSTDRTSALAAAAGARVVFEPVNQISRARNAGAAVATGDWLLFVDADSEVSAGLMAALWAQVEGGRVIGAGSTLAMSGLPWSASLMLGCWNLLSRRCRWAAGSLLLCRRADFTAVGGFSERLYAAEEIDLSRRLKRRARLQGLGFVILHRHPLLTSARKLALYSGGEIAAQLVRLVLRPWASLRDRGRLGVWYDGRRER